MTVGCVPPRGHTVRNRCFFLCLFELKTFKGAMEDAMAPTCSGLDCRRPSHSRNIPSHCTVPMAMLVVLPFCAENTGLIPRNRSRLAPLLRNLALGVDRNAICTVHSLKSRVGSRTHDANYRLYLLGSGH